MPDALEFPGMLRAVIPLVRAGDAIVFEFVADRFPGLAAVAGALNQLPKPTAALRSVESIGIGGRTLEVENLPTGKMRAGNVPTLALAVGSQNECAFARAHQHSYAAHTRLPVSES